MNNRSMASGSGTTSQARRERRQRMQWTFLSQAGPPCTSPESLEEKLEALRKAQASAEEQLKQKKEALKEEEAALKKAEEDLDKALSKRGKTGTRSRSQSRARLSSVEEAAKRENAPQGQADQAAGQAQAGDRPSQFLEKGQGHILEKGCPNLLLLLWGSHHILENGKENLQKARPGMIRP